MSVNLAGSTVTPCSPSDSRMLVRVRSRAKFTGLIGNWLRNLSRWSVTKSTVSTRKWPLPIAGSSTRRSNKLSTEWHLNLTQLVCSIELANQGDFESLVGFHAVHLQNLGLSQTRPSSPLDCRSTPTIPSHCP